MRKEKLRIVLPVIILSILIMACGLMQISKPGDNIPAGVPPVSMTPDATDNSNSTGPTDSSTAPATNPGGGSSDQGAFPLPPNATVLSNAAGVETVQVKMSFDDVVSYYRNELTKEGLTEDTTLSVVNKPAFALQFKGSKNGKTLFIQGADAGDGTVAYTITYQ